MEVDSVHLADNEFVQRIHSTRTSGKLHRGHNITAATSSIPSKYQTIVISNADRKGFMTGSKRFNQDFENTNPGPGNYVSHGAIEKSSASFSKKGTGGFASNDRRISKHESTCSPGSGAYSLPSMLVTRNDFNRTQSTSVFHKPIAQPRDNLHESPAPNHYKVTQVKVGKAQNVSAEAAFKSRSKRDPFNVGDNRSKPAPWQYHVKDELVKDSVKVPFSSFKSKSERKMQENPAPVPGPGAYRPNEPIEPVPKTVFPRKHYLCISAPAMPLPSTPPAPGPGHYEVVNYEGAPKHFMSGAAFVSTTSRWTGDTRNTEQPGPAHYRPHGVAKQSFIYNSSNRWI